MRLDHFPDTNSLYNDPSLKPSFKSREVSECVVLGYDREESLVGIDIDFASYKLDLSGVITSQIPHRATA